MSAHCKKCVKCSFNFEIIKKVCSVPVDKAGEEEANDVHGDVEGDGDSWGEGEGWIFLKSRTAEIFFSALKHSEAFRMQTNFSCLGKDLPALVELDESATCILGCIFGGDFDFAWMVLRILGVLSCV